VDEKACSQMRILEATVWTLTNAIGSLVGEGAMEVIATFPFHCALVATTELSTSGYVPTEFNGPTSHVLVQMGNVQKRHLPPPQIGCGCLNGGERGGNTWIFF